MIYGEIQCDDSTFSVIKNVHFLKFWKKQILQFPLTTIKTPRKTAAKCKDSALQHKKQNQSEKYMHDSDLLFMAEIPC